MCVHVSCYAVPLSLAHVYRTLSILKFEPPGPCFQKGPGGRRAYHVSVLLAKAPRPASVGRVSSLNLEAVGEVAGLL